jgi:photosystem II stability/assembly factor-like uncharacterized protein
MKRVHAFLPPVVLLALMFKCDFAFSQTITWQQTNGPYGFGNVTAIVINSQDQIFIGTDGGGIFRSNDNGESWTYMGLGGHGVGVKGMAINSQDHIFVGSGESSVWRSLDNGETWTLGERGLTNHYVFSLAINSQGHIFAGTGSYVDGLPGSGIFRSTDNGDSWNPVSPNLADVIIISLAVGPDDVLFAGTAGKGVYRSTDNGDTWIQKGLDSTDVSSLLIHPNGYVFAGMWVATPSPTPTTPERVLFRSTDNGETWANTGFYAFGGGIVYLAANSIGDIFVVESGISRSSDYGASWEQINSGLTDIGINAIAFNSQGHVFAGQVNNGSVARSTDNGENWKEFNSGLINFTAGAIAISPGFVFASHAGFFRSSDFGESWTDVGLGGRCGQCLAINSKGHIFAGATGGCAPGEPSYVGIFRSTDNGESWTEIGNDLLSDTPVSAIAINSQGHLFVGTGDHNTRSGGEGIFRSTDNGENWVKLNTELISAEVWTLAINSNDHIFAGTKDGLYRSTDNGETWVNLIPGLSEIQFWSIAINNSNGHIFAVTCAPPSGVTPPSPVMRSIDNGDSWTDIGGAVNWPCVRAIVVNSNGDLFVGTGKGAYYSPDEGESWTEINTGLIGRRDVYTLAAHPNGFIFASCFATGVFRTVESTTVVHPPAAPTLAFPPNGAVDRPTTLTLHWNPYASVESYHLQVATTSDFVSPIVDDSTIITASREIGSLQNNTAYYWRVQAKYVGGTSPWSEAWRFTTTVGIAISPSDVEFGEVVAGEIATQDVTITNTGTAILNVSSISLVGESANNFSVDTSPFTLAPNASKTLEVSFSPLRGGRISAVLFITVDAWNSKVDLKGTGILATFTQITSGDIVNNEGTSFGNSWGDYDNDGDLDLFVANGGNNFLYANNGDGIFTKITSGAIVNDGGNSRAGTWGDYDNDGDLDLFVANGADGDAENNFLYRNNGNATFTKITQGAIVNDGGPSISAAWGDYDNDGDLDLFVANKAANNYLYQNNGGGTFTKITAGAVVNDVGISYGCSWVDYDDDGDLDLFVVNGDGDNNFLYRNNGNGTFAKITTSAIIFNEGGNPRGHSWGDYDNDGDLDLFVANCCGINNFLYANNGDGTFTKIIDRDVVNDGGNSHGSGWGDYDNDGDLDLFVANASSRKNALYANNGDGAFTKITTGAIVNDNANTFACTWSDYDNDGDLDLFDANDNENNILYRNNGNSNHWINVKCTGTVSNTSAIGAKVRVKTIIQGRAIWQLQEISAQTGWGSQNSLNVEFGLGDATVIDSLKIEWPSRIVHFFTNLQANQFIEIREDSTLTDVAEPLPDIPLEYSLEQNYPNPFSQIPRFAGNPSTQIAFSIPRSGYTTLKIYNILGREIAVLMAKKLEAGRYKVSWNTSGLPSGLYFYRLQSSEFVATKKMVLLR